MSSKSIAKAALKAGLKIFPCNADKTPACKGGYKSAVSNTDAFTKLLAQGAKDDYLVGLPMAPNNLIAIDYDIHKMSDSQSNPNRSEADPDPDENTQQEDAWHSYAHFEQHKHILQKTPSGGYHLICRLPTFDVANAANVKIGKWNPSHIDIRTDGYIIIYDAAIISRLAEAEPVPTVIYQDLVALHENRFKEGITRQTLGVLGDWLLANEWSSGDLTANGWYHLKCPWSANHSTGKEGDSSTGFIVNGDSANFQCFHASCSNKQTPDFIKFFKEQGAPVGRGNYSTNYSASELHNAIQRAADVRPERVEWLIDGLIPRRHLTLLAGDSGIGKTTLALHLVAQASIGGYAPNGAKIAPARSLIITNEDDAASIIVPRLIAAGADMSKVAIIDDTNQFDISDPAQFEVFYQEFIQHKLEYEFIIIDAFSIIGSQAKNSHNADQMRKIITQYRNMAKNTKVAILGVMHIRKLQSHAGYVPLKDYLSGSKTYTNMARSVLMCVQHVREPELCSFGQVKGNLNKIEGHIPYNIEQIHIKVTDSEGKQVEVGTSAVNFHKWDASSTLEQIYEDLVKPPSKREAKNTVMGQAVRDELKRREDGTMTREEVAEFLAERFNKGKAAFVQRMWSDPGFYHDEVGALYIKGMKGQQAHYRLLPDEAWVKGDYDLEEANLSTSY